MSKSYYEILNVNKNASQDEIKKSFRKLSKQYHPDLAENKAEAEEKYKEITQAYDVLSDEEKRKRYDMLGHDNYVNGGSSASGFEGFGSGFGGFGNGGFHFESTGGFGGFEDIFESFFGGGRRVNTKGEDLQISVEVTLEEIAKGIKKDLKYRRKTEKGYEEIEKSITLPKGVEHGKRFVIREGGNIGTAYKDIPAQYGDLYIVVIQKQHKYFNRVNHYDLEYVLKLDALDAILGTTVEIPTLTDEKSKVNIPAGTQNDKLFKLSGKGIDGGSIYIRVSIEIPKKISSKQKKLYEEIRNIRDGKESDKSFFENLFHK